MLQTRPIVEMLIASKNDIKNHIVNDCIQLCTVDMEIRDLERLTINLVPETVFMESDTVLVQYIISSWSLQLRCLSSKIAKIVNNHFFQEFQ